MGYDVSFHPISPGEKYGNGDFTPLNPGYSRDRRKRCWHLCRTVMEWRDFYAEKYLDTLRVGATAQYPDEDCLTRGHGFSVYAVIQMVSFRGLLIDHQRQ